MVSEQCHPQFRLLETAVQAACTLRKDADDFPRFQKGQCHSQSLSVGFPAVYGEGAGPADEEAQDGNGEQFVFCHIPDAARQRGSYHWRVGVTGVIDCEDYAAALR